MSGWTQADRARRHLTPLRRRLYPELSLTPGGTDPRVIEHEARGRLFLQDVRWRFSARTALWCFAPVALACVFIALVVIDVIPYPFDWRTLLVIGPLFGVADLLRRRDTYRMRVRRMMREVLRERGVGVCLGCGYDLRGLPSEQRACPECGAAIEATQETSGSSG
jgi:hypothetical protein